MADDGVNRDGLDYRAGWCEALRALAGVLQVEGAGTAARPAGERAIPYCRGDQES